MRSSAEIVVFDNIELNVVVEEGALDWPEVEEDMKSEVSKEEGKVLASSNVCVEPLS